MKRTASKTRKSTPSVKLRTNGHKAIDAKSSMRMPTSTQRRFIRTNQTNRWQFPGVAAFTPTYVELILRGAMMGDHVRQWELFDLMLDTWPTLASCQQELLYGIMRRDLVFDPYAEEDEDATDSAIEKEKLVTAAVRSMNPTAQNGENSLDGTIQDIMDGWFRGVSVLEIVWQLTDTKVIGQAWTPQSTYWAHPSYYGFDRMGNIGLTDPGSPYGYSDPTAAAPGNMVLQPVPPNKFLVCIHKVKSGSPLGGPMLRALAWWWCASNFSSDWLLNLAQIFGLPFRWANYPGTAPDDTINAICDMLQNMGNSGWAAFPEGTTLELKEATRTGNLSPQADLLDRADHYARLLILGQTMTGATIASGRGGQAFGTVEAQLKQDRLDAAAGYVEGVINRQLIPAILMMNYGEATEPPTCRFLQENVGTYQDAQRDQLLAALGVPIPFSYLQDKYAIPTPTGGEETTKPPPAPMATPPVSAGPKGTSPISKALPPTGPRQAAVAKFQEISQIEDFEVWARELRTLATDLVLTKELPDE